MRFPAGIRSSSLIGLALALLALVLWLVRSDTRLDPQARGARGAEASVASATEPSAAFELEPQADAQATTRAASPSGARALRGRVVEANSGRGLENFDVRVRGADGSVAEVTSGEGGRFALDAPSEGALELRVICPYGWIALDTPRTLEPDAQGEYEELLIRARAAGFAPLHLLLVDERTGQAVPHYLVRVGAREGSRMDLWSDARGELRSAGELPEGPLLLFGYDSRHADSGPGESLAHWYREWRHAPLAPGAAPLELAIAVGPTYRLELDAPPNAPLERLGALISTHAPSYVGRGTLERRDLGHIRSNDGWWVRFPPWARSDPSPGVLTLLSFDGRWRGEAEVSTRLGIDPRTVSIRLEPHSRLLGRAVDRAGVALANVTIALFGENRAGELAELDQERSSGNGLFEFKFIPAGRYVVRGSSLQAFPGQVERQVSGYEDDEFELVLERVAAPAKLRGVVLAPAELGELGSLVVSARSLRGVGEEFELELPSPSGEGLRRAPFAFEELPEGQYEIVAYANAEGPLWPVRASVEASAPGPELTLELPHASRVRCLEFTCIDAHSGEPLDDAALHFIRCQEAFLSRPDSPRASHCFVTDDVNARWLARASGYVPRSGALSELEFVNGEARLEVALERGWGARIEVCEPDLAPAAAVELWVDGERAGLTDARGVCEFRRANAPRSLELRRPGWSLEVASEVALGELLRGEYGFARVWISPQ